jgi:hypothetical protein
MTTVTKADAEILRNSITALWDVQATAGERIAAIWAMQEHRRVLVLGPDLATAEKWIEGNGISLEYCEVVVRVDQIRKPGLRALIRLTGPLLPAYHAKWERNLAFLTGSLVVLEGGWR